MPGEARRRRLRALLERSGAAQVDPAAIEPAFVHESAARERGIASNERLEFFGDAILGFVTARYVYAKYTAAAEGELTQRKNALISRESCAITAGRLALGELIVVGNGLQRAGGIENTSILGNTLEAYIAALFLATDLPTVTAFIEREHLAALDRAEPLGNDAKSALQELAQARGRTVAGVLRAGRRSAARSALHFAGSRRRRDLGRRDRLLEEGRAVERGGDGARGAARANSS